MALKTQRNDVRYPVAIPVLLTRGRSQVSLVTENVSARGAFVLTSSPPMMRQLVRLRFELPSGAFVDVHAMVVHVVPPGGSRPAGIGVQFWGLEAKFTGPWTAFIKSCSQVTRAASIEARSRTYSDIPFSNPDEIGLVLVE